MSGIVTQDSISLTESLDGVRFSCLAAFFFFLGKLEQSDGAPNTERTLDTTKGSTPLSKLSSEENWYWAGRLQVLVTQMLSLSLDTLYVSEAWNWSLVLSFVKPYYVISVQPCEVMPSLTHRTLNMHWFSTDSRKGMTYIPEPNKDNILL